MTINPLPPSDATPIPASSAPVPGAPVQVTRTSTKSELLKGLSLTLGIIMGVVGGNSHLAEDLQKILGWNAERTQAVASFLSILSSVWYMIMKSTSATTHQTIVNYSPTELLTPIGNQEVGDRGI